MKIFVAGATGAIGQPLLVQLVAEGHEVFGLTRTPERASSISALGAIPLIADVLDFASIEDGIKKIQPEVVVDMLTSLPKEYTPQSMRQAKELDKKIRIEGGAHLQKAAQAAGTRRYILQSCAFWYEPGIGLADEDTPFAFDASPAVAAGAQVYAQMENRVLEAHSLEGIALRLGFLYGLGTWYAASGSMASSVRSQNYPIVGGGHGVWNFVHVEDVAQAISLCLDCTPGAYNIVDDTPIEVAAWLPAYAKWLIAPPPLERSAEEELALNGPDSVYYATALRGASNAKAKRDLGFLPRRLEWMEK